MLDIRSYPHQVTRLAFDTGQPYEKFRSRYEAAVPQLDPRRLAAFNGRHARWQEVAAEAGPSGPHGFLIYWRADMTPVLTTADDARPCTAYLMGDHTTAEAVYRHDPSAMLYVPLQTVIYIDAGDRTRLVVDQPSTVFASFSNPRITQARIELDRKLADLLEALGVPGRQALTTDAPTAHGNGQARPSPAVVRRAAERLRPPRWLLDSVRLVPGDRSLRRRFSR